MKLSDAKIMMILQHILMIVFFSLMVYSFIVGNFFGAAIYGLFFAISFIIWKMNRKRSSNGKNYSLGA